MEESPSQHPSDHFEIKKTANGITLKLADGTIASVVKTDVNRDDLVGISIELGWLAGNFKMLSTLQGSVSAAEAVREYVREEFEVDAKLPVNEMADHSQKITIPATIGQIVSTLRSLKQLGVVSFSIQGQPFVSTADELQRYLKMIPPSA